MKTDVKAKKHLGQHFLTDLTIAQNIVDGLSKTDSYKKVLEIGPGMGVLTQFLIQNKNYQTYLIDIDTESIVYLKKHFVEIENNIVEGDFLNMDLQTIAHQEPFAVIGNFPYNISTQILFKILDYKDQIPEMVGMFQKEVAERVASQPGSKVYGITSVLIQAFYDVEYLFTVNENVFNPPPKVKSGVIRLIRNKKSNLNCNESMFKTVVKTAFNQRRKTLRNSLKSFIKEEYLDNPIFTLRPEALSVEQFIELTSLLDNN
ncbi:MAG: 16S rRNA (adenine(1518)-N(6)/adenine(1519)-N(6))-dimethyltransferase RsmA [Flavobacteriales bacterium]|nr:16S rRNA (adenine(1518)-N(6)/adenine(1519)-N(6))-dimethyltransferase RsmA [Flavobacteriales bacterium]